MPWAFISEFDVVSFHYWLEGLPWLEGILQRLLMVGMQMNLVVSMAMWLCPEVVLCICQN